MKEGLPNKKCLGPGPSSGARGGKLLMFAKRCLVGGAAASKLAMVGVCTHKDSVSAGRDNYGVARCGRTKSGCQGRCTFAYQRQRLGPRSIKGEACKLLLRGGRDRLPLFGISRCVRLHRDRHL
jgi:hypothetical protein